MGDEYQLRKDIDRLSIQIDNIDYSDFVTKDKLEDEIIKVDNDLDLLKADLLHIIQNHIRIISPKFLLSSETIDIKAMPFENNNIEVGRRVYFFAKED